jgi:hypothetical protein
MFDDFNLIESVGLLVEIVRIQVSDRLIVQLLLYSSC